MQKEYPDELDELANELPDTWMNDLDDYGVERDESIPSKFKLKYSFVDLETYDSGEKLYLGKVTFRGVTGNKEEMNELLGDQVENAVEKIEDIESVRTSYRLV